MFFAFMLLWVLWLLIFNVGVFVASEASEEALRFIEVNCYSGNLATVVVFSVYAIHADGADYVAGLREFYRIALGDVVKNCFSSVGVRFFAFIVVGLFGVVFCIAKLTLYSKTTKIFANKTHKIRSLSHFCIV